MKTNGKITVRYLRSNELYDIYVVTGFQNEKEEPEPIYTKRPRNQGYDEEEVLNDYI